MTEPWFNGQDTGIICQSDQKAPSKIKHANDINHYKNVQCHKTYGTQ